MKFLTILLSLSLLPTACNKRKADQGAQNPPGTEDKSSDGSTKTPPTDGASSDKDETPDTRPLAATVSSQTFACDTFDSAIYWYGKGDMAQKASETTRSSFFDPRKPTVIYVHGWQAGSHSLEKRTTFNYGKYDPIYGLKIDAADAWVDGGWNIGIFYWNQISDELSPNTVEDKIWGERNVTWKDCKGRATAIDGSPKSVVELIAKTYGTAMKGYKGSNIRLVGHSIGNQLVTKLAEKLEQDARLGTVDARLVPKRVALVDPWWSAATRSSNRAGTLRGVIQNLKSKGMIFEWYKTSSMSDNNKSDPNTDLIPIIGQSEWGADYYSSINQMSRHMAAPFLYFLSFSTPAPPGCIKPCTELAPSAATSDERLKELMQSPTRWRQVEGRETPETGDNTFERVLP